MALQATKVLYDVSQAISELLKLDKKVDKSGKKAKSGFKLADVSVEKLGDSIGKVNPTLGKMVTKFGGLAVAAGPAAVAIGAIGAAAAFVAANFFDLAGAMRDADKTLGDFLSNAKKTQELREILSTSGDVTQQESFLHAKDQIARKRLLITQAQIEVDASRTIAAKKLTIEKELLADIAAFRAKTTSKTTSLEERLADRQRKSLVGNVGAGKPTGAAIVDLAARAKQEADKGNLDTAEALVAKAQQLSDELGNHSFFTNKIESANKSIDQSLKDQIKDSKGEEAAITSLLGLQQKQVDVAKDRLAEEVAITKEIANRLKLLSAQGSVIRRGGIAEARTEKVDLGVRNLESGVEGAAGQIQSRATEGSINQFLQNVSDGLKATFSINAFKFAGQKTETRDLENAVLDAFELASRENVTKADLNEATKILIDARKTERRFQTELSQGIRSGGTKRQVESIDKLITALTAAVAATGQFGPIQDPNASILAERAATQAKSDVFQGEAAAFSANINVTAEIKGGVFDADAVKGLTDTIRREVRKEVTRQGGD